MLLIWMIRLSLLFVPALHPYYVSVTELEYHAGTREMGIACKLFTDDLEEVIRDAGAGKTDLTHGNRESNKRLLEDYLRRHLAIWTDGKAVTPKFLGFEFDQEAIWCYFEAGDIPPFKRLTIRGDMLFEHKKEQINLFHVTVNGHRKSHRLVQPDRSFSLDFKP